MAHNFKERDVVEFETSSSRMVVAMVNGNQLVVKKDDGTVTVVDANSVIAYPGDDYARLRFLVIRAMEEARRRSSDYSGISVLVARDLYAKGVRDTDFVAQNIVRIVSGALTTVAAEQIKDALRENLAPVSVVAAEPQTVEHFTPEGQETLQPGLSNTDLVRLVVRFANELAAFNGYTTGSAGREDCSLKELYEEVRDWLKSRNSRRQAVWQKAVRMVDIARQSEAEDAINELVASFEDDEEEDL
ncbi:hypothetical protein SLP22_0055 [Salmonella phage BAU.Micro_SLP-22]|nr:hypothetical protein SLP22_00023 [Salmonella phage BAU.Micro_SLP-22]